VGSAGAMVTAEVNAVGAPPPVPGVMVTLRAPMLALLAAENWIVSAVEETTVVEWTVTPLPETETVVPVLKYAPTIEASNRLSPGRQLEDVIDVSVGDWEVTCSPFVSVPVALPPAEGWV
jgi:hypothetical protein